MAVNINLDAEYDSIVLANILANVPDHSEVIINKTLDLDKFLDITMQVFKNHNFKYYERLQLTTDASQKTLEPMYIDSYYIAEDIAFMYSIEHDVYSTDLDDLDEDDIEEIEIEGLDDLDIINGAVEMSEQMTNNDKDACFGIRFYYNEVTKPLIIKLLPLLNEAIPHVEIPDSFYTIGVSTYGYMLQKQNATVLELDIPLHYGDEFVPVYEDMIDSLTNKTHGLILLHGTPGTAKTTLIRHLISKICSKKKIIYVPSYMIEQLASPEFITFLQKHKNSILILEDAEYALQARESEFGVQAVSNLLNITNGLLNDATQIQVIATFNMDKKNIDPALLRAGRLLTEWKFDKLSVEDAKRLAKAIDKDLDITEPMTVAEIYNGKAKAIKQKNKKRIGFKD